MYAILKRAKKAAGKKPNEVMWEMGDSRIFLTYEEALQARDINEQHDKAGKTTFSVFNLS